MKEEQMQQETAGMKASRSANPDSPTVIGAVILAAGESRRLGRPKQLLAFGEDVLLDVVIAAVALPEIEACVVVLGAYAAEIQARVRCDECEMMVNVRWRAGMLTSVQAGIGALPPTCEWAVVFPCDYALVGKDTVARLLLRASRNPEADFLVPASMGRGGHPIVLRHTLFKNILALPTTARLDEALKSMARRELVEVPDPAIHIDIDTAEQYERAALAWNARKLATESYARMLTCDENGRGDA